MIVEKSVDEQLTSRRRIGLQDVNSQPNFANTKKYHEKIPNYCPTISSLV
jgi:hypothetical protein